MKIANMKHLGELVRAKRRKEGLTQQELADMTQTNPYQVSTIENGNGHAVLADALVRIVEGLGFEFRQEGFELHLELSGAGKP